MYVVLRGKLSVIYQTPSEIAPI